MNAAHATVARVVLRLGNERVPGGEKVPELALSLVGSAFVTSGKVPIVLFVWGAARVVPVIVNSELAKKHPLSCFDVFQSCRVSARHSETLDEEHMQALIEGVSPDTDLRKPDGSVMISRRERVDDITSQPRIDQ